MQRSAAPLLPRDTMTHLIQTPSRTNASGAWTISDPGALPCVQCALRVAIILLGLPFPLFQTFAFAIVCLAMTVLGLIAGVRSAAWPIL